MISLRRIGSAFCLVLLMVLPVLAGDLPTAVVVTDDNNNLRAFGGPNYLQAPVVGRLDKGDHLRVTERSPGWARVGLPDGRSGSVHDACLQEAVGPDHPGEMDPELHSRMDRFLTMLAKTVQTGNFGAVELLLHPNGVVVNGRLFADAAQPPETQAPAVTPLWYATDVSLTWGTAWELLVTGTRPPAGMRVAWDEADERFVVMEPGMSEEHALGEAYPEQGLLPMHARALRLSPDVAFVPGWPLAVQGYPLAEAWRDDFVSAPFALVYQTGPTAWRLEQADHIGLMLYVEEVGGALKLRGVATQAW